MSSPASTVNKPLHVSLFLGSCLTTFFAARFLFGADESDSVVYAFVVMLILLCHELGHFFMARAHGVDASWPYFIPVPLGFGTMGAVIRLKGRIPTRNALVDIGAAGPLAGLLIAIPMLFVGVGFLSVEQLPADFHATDFPPPLSLINLASMGGLYIKHLLFDTPAPVMPVYELFGDNLITLFAVRVLHGELPGGSDLIAHPVFLAAWFGLVMTMLNLLPVGQLDGGHLTHAWYGEKAERIGERVAGAALIMALFFSASWLVWFFFITRLVGVEHPPVERPEEPLSRGRKAVVIITWVLTALTFMPIPMSLG